LSRKAALSATSASQAIEREGQNGRSHLAAKPASLVRAPKPRPCVDGPDDRETIGVDGLAADGRAIKLDQEIQPHASGANRAHMPQ
jgi:hypothetical protein